MSEVRAKLARIELRHKELAAKVLEWGKFRDTVHVSQMLATFEQQVTANVRLALLEAANECAEHNSEYHHTTDPAKIESWKTLAMEEV